MMLDNLKFRQLENGWTVKYHLCESQLPDAKRFGGEVYVKDIVELQSAVAGLIAKHMKEAGQ